MKKKTMLLSVIMGIYTFSVIREKKKSKTVMLCGYLVVFLCRIYNLHEKMHGLCGIIELFMSLGAASIKKLIYHSIFGGGVLSFFSFSLKHL